MEYLLDKTSLNQRTHQIEDVIDYLNQEAYLIDINLEEDNYKQFFETLYEFFKAKELSPFYYRIMAEYINRCMILSCAKNKMNSSDLMNHLDFLNTVSKEFHLKLSEEDMNLLRQKVKSKKYLVLTEKTM